MQAELLEIINETDHVRRFLFRAADRSALDFVPGQFVIVTIPGLPQFENTRSYSIASAPNGGNTFELCISINPNGFATPVLWAMLPGSILEMSEPQGSFIVQDGLDLETTFICTGTGIAPFRSMVQALLGQGHANPVNLIFGNRMEADILYRKEWEVLAAKHSNFRFYPVLSREENWSGEKGYVHQVYQHLFADGRDARFYICGWKEMCSDARKNLKALGYNRRQYFFELYD